MVEEGPRAWGTGTEPTRFLTQLDSADPTDQGSFVEGGIGHQLEE